jgi:hypothetical protein
MNNVAQISESQGNMYHKLFPEFIVEFHLMLPHGVTSLQYNRAALRSFITQHVSSSALYVPIIYIISVINNTKILL